MSVVQETIQCSVLCHDVVHINDHAGFDELRAAAEGWTECGDGYDFWGTDADGCEWRVHLEV